MRHVEQHRVDLADPAVPSGFHNPPASPLLHLMLSISVIAPLFTFRRSTVIVLEPSALSQNVCATFFSAPFSVMLAFAACGSFVGSFDGSLRDGAGCERRRESTRQMSRKC